MSNLEIALGIIASAEAFVIWFCFYALNKLWREAVDQETPLDPIDTEGWK